MKSPPDGGLFHGIVFQQVQHIIGMPLQLIIIGMPHSTIFIIRAQQFLNISMFMPCIGIILHIILPSACMPHSIMHFMAGIGMPIIIGIMFIMGMPIIGIMPMPAWDMHIIDMLPQCIIIGMPQSIIMDIISQLFLNIAMSMPAAGIMVHSMQSSIILHCMVAIIMGMPIGIIGIPAFIGICIAFIMGQAPCQVER
jgi:hypothetical protein